MNNVGELHPWGFAYVERNTVRIVLTWQDIVEGATPNLQRDEMMHKNQ